MQGDRRCAPHGPPVTTLRFALEAAVNGSARLRARHTNGLKAPRRCGRRPIRRRHSHPVTVAAAAPPWLLTMAIAGSRGLKHPASRREGAQPSNPACRRCPRWCSLGVPSTRAGECRFGWGYTSHLPVGCRNLVASSRRTVCRTIVFLHPTRACERLGCARLLLSTFSRGAPRQAAAVWS